MRGRACILFVAWSFQACVPSASPTGPGSVMASAEDLVAVPPVSASTPRPSSPEGGQTPAASSLTVPKSEGPRLEIVDDEIGTGEVARSGDKVHVHYTGRFADGRRFDSSLDRGQTFAFVLGAGEVIKGWDQGVLGMKEGGKRRLVVPPEFGYGPGGRPPVIPAGAVLYFEVELVRVGR